MVRLVFVAAIPAPLNNEYLRILGAISRVCSEQAPMEALLKAPDATSFVKLLEKGCIQ